MSGVVGRVVGGVTVRQDEPGDVPGIARVHVAGWQWAYRGLMPADYLASLDPAPREAMWARRLASEEGRGHVAVALEDSELIGFVAWTRYRGDDLAPGTLPDAVGEVSAIYLGRANQGRGAGRALLARAVERLTVAGFTEAKLWVLEGNALARRFYQRQGWAPDGGRKIDEERDFALPEIRYGRPLARGRTMTNE